MLKRLITMIVGIAILAVVMMLSNTFVFHLAITIVAVIGMHEFYHAMRQIDIKPIEWLGYISTLSLLFIPYVSITTVRMALTISLPILLLVSFCISIFSNMKKNILDISTTIFGIIYITYLFAFITFTKHLNNGIYYVWFILGGAWITDTFAYMIGKLFDIVYKNHKFSKISPNKSIEGCIGGIVGCTLFFIGYAYYLNSIGMELNYFLMAIIGIVTSIISQIGDFAASAIKRYCKIKDFGNIMPGHGGILDRFDSILLIAPFIYTICSVLL